MADVGAEHVVSWLMDLRFQATWLLAEVDFELAKAVGDRRHAALTEPDGNDPLNPYRRVEAARR